MSLGPVPPGMNTRSNYFKNSREIANRIEAYEKYRAKQRLERIDGLTNLFFAKLIEMKKGEVLSNSNITELKQQARREATEYVDTPKKYVPRISSKGGKYRSRYTRKTHCKRRHTSLKRK